MFGHAKRFMRKVAGHLPAPSLDSRLLRARHDDVLAWLDKAQQHIGSLPAPAVALNHAHELHRGGYAVTMFAPEIGRKLDEHLRMQWDILQGGGDPVPVLSTVVHDIVRWKTIIQCRDAHTTGGYYDDAEPVMAYQ